MNRQQLPQPAEALATGFRAQEIRLPARSQKHDARNRGEASA